MLVQGDATVVEQPSPERRAEVTTQAARYLGPTPGGRFWRWWLREYGEVIVVLGDNLLDQPFDPYGSRERYEPVVALPERAKQLLVALGQIGRKAALDPCEERSSSGSPAKKEERVVRHSHERRGEHGDECLVVVAVVQQP